MSGLHRLTRWIKRDSPVVSRAPMFALAGLSVYVVFGVVWLLTEPMRAQVARPTRTPWPSFTPVAAADRFLVVTATRTATPTASPTATFTPTPTRVPTSTPTSTPTIELQQHTVRRGETLTAIAARYEVEVAELLKINGLSESDLLIAGRSLRLPPDARVPAEDALVHIVQSGDTVWGIASFYGVDYASLLRVNGLGPNDLLQQGQQLIIPE